MADHVKAPETRRDRARRTRLRIVAAAHELFCERGYSGTRMADVAEAAGVAVQTVYFTFHTKAELLRACYEVAVLGADDPTPPQAQPWHRRLLDATDGSEAMAHFAAGNFAITARVAVLDDVIRSVVQEPEATAVRERGELLRRAGYRTVVEHLESRFGLRSGLDVDRATDVMLMLGGAAPYRSLVVDYGWSEQRFVEWLTAALVRELLGAEAP
jgi:AcrR family transcriptional regulator